MSHHDTLWCLVAAELWGPHPEPERTGNEYVFARHEYVGCVYPMPVTQVMVINLSIKSFVPVLCQMLYSPYIPYFIQHLRFIGEGPRQRTPGNVFKGPEGVRAASVQIQGLIPEPILLLKSCWT